MKRNTIRLRWHLRAACTGLMVCVASVAGPQVGAAPVASLAGQHHRGWSFADGAPADVWALAQAPDGHLWLGTGSGLYRFDGLRFEAVPPAVGHPPASGNITALTIDQDGAAWTGFYAGGVAKWRQGMLDHGGVQEGLPEGMVYRIVDDGRGTAWAAVDGGLARHHGGRWQTMTAGDGYPWTHADWLLLDRDGTLWVSTGDTIVYRARGEEGFTRTGIRSSLPAVIEEAPDGAIWVSDSHGTRVIRAARNGTSHPPLPDLYAKRLLFDRDGSLWGTDARNGGAFRIGIDDDGGTRVDRFGPTQGLTAHVAVPVLQDREGSIWVGTNLGLDRFRRTPIMAIPELADTAPAGYGLAVVAGRAAIASGGALHDVDGRGARRRLGGLPTVLAAHAEADGTLWLAGDEKLLRVRQGDVADVPLPDGRRGRDIRAMASDESGMWFSIMHQGLYRFRAGQWSLEPLHGQRVPDVVATDRGATWLGFPGDRVEWRQGTRIRTFAAADGLSVGNVSAIHVADGAVYVAGERGLAWFDGQRFHTLSQQRVRALDGITGIVAVGDELWLNGNLGLLRVSRTALRRSADPAYRLPEPLLLDALDGVPGIALQATPVPTLLRGEGNVLWLATNQGAAWFDTQRLPRNREIPSVSIRSVVADGHAFAPVPSLALPKRTASLQIDYTATSLAMPERVRFRYRLEGLDEDWVEAGTRRQAFYTNPPPGEYVFRVIAANQDGLWNMQGAALPMTMAPMFYQAWWFLAACVLAACGVLWVLYLLRLKELGVHIRSRLHERHVERERIARELHDTLLQGIQGLILRFQAVAEHLPADAASRHEMERALDRADGVLAEGRNRVLDLRASSTDGDDLSEAYAKVAAELAIDHPVPFRIVSEGAVQPLDPIVRDELFRIGREALLNAYRHAGARTVEVEIVHARDELRLRFMDDGRGIDATVLETGRAGHWGLQGMRERAERIEATLCIRSRQGAGTEVEIRMPAATAYRPCLGKSRWTLVRRLFREESPS